MHGVVLKNFMIVNELWTKNVFSISYFMNSQCSDLAHWREPGVLTIYQNHPVGNFRHKH